jgi:hypothetical protein
MDTGIRVALRFQRRISIGNEGQADMPNNCFGTRAHKANCRASSSIPCGFRFLSSRYSLCRRLVLFQASYQGDWYPAPHLGM